MEAYVNGWQRAGMLTLDSLRASRLVVDTGMHAVRISSLRQRAIDFLYAHTAFARSNVEAEIDRYIADLGQAASYMIGRPRTCRDFVYEPTPPPDWARRNRFSIRSFHDTILHGGMTPLDELSPRQRLDASSAAYPATDHAAALSTACN